MRTLDCWQLGWKDDPLTSQLWHKARFGEVRLTHMVAQTLWSVITRTLISDFYILHTLALLRVVKSVAHGWQHHESVG